MNKFFEKVKEYRDRDWFNIGEDKQYKKLIRLLFYIAIGCAFSALLLYVILEIFSDRESKLSEYNKTVKKWRKTTEPQKLSSIGVGLRITPSENTEGNIILMEYRNKDLLKERKLKKVYNYSQAYYLHTDTTLYFPTLHFTSDEVPFGDSEEYCINLRWAPRENARVLDLYSDVENFPACKKAFNDKIDWREHDSRYGAGVNAWLQSSEEMKGCNSIKACQSKCDSRKGIVKKTYGRTYICYWYKVLTDVCLMISYNQTSGGWEYAGGCFEDNSASRMVNAIPGEVYTFDKIRIQVRSRIDPYIVATLRNAKEKDFSFGIDIDFLYTLAFIIFIAAVVFGIIIAVGVIFKDKIRKTSVYKDYIEKNELINQDTESKPIGGTPEFT